MKIRLVKKQRCRVEWETRRSQKRAVDSHERWEKMRIHAELERLSNMVYRMIVSGVHSS